MSDMQLLSWDDLIKRRWTLFRWSHTRKLVLIIMKSLVWLCLKNCIWISLVNENLGELNIKTTCSSTVQFSNGNFFVGGISNQTVRTMTTVFLKIWTTVSQERTCGFMTARNENLFGTGRRSCGNRGRVFSYSLVAKRNYKAAKMVGWEIRFSDMYFLTILFKVPHEQ